MKKFFIPILRLMLLLTFCSSLHAQRCLPKMSFVEASTGIIEKNGFSVNIGYGIFAKHQHYWAFHADFLQKNYAYQTEKIPLRQFSLDGGYFINIFADRKKSFFVNLGLSAIIGYETINMNKKTLPDGAILKNKDAFIYGGVLSLIAEYYLSDRYVGSLQVRQRITAGSQVSLFHTQFNVGLKIIL